MTDKSEEIFAEFQEKFLEAYKETAENCNETFLTDFQIWNYMLTHFTDEQILKFLPQYIHEIFVYDDDKVKWYGSVVKSWSETISEQQQEKISEAMCKASISQGEAMILADKAFNDQIGYFNSFAMCLFSGIITTIDTIKEGEIG